MKLNFDGVMHETEKKTVRNLNIGHQVHNIPCIKQKNY